MQPAKKMSRLGRAAAIYALELGWRVFPLHSIVDGACSCGSATCTGTKPGKHPRTPRGCLDATTDTAQIAAWWSQWPEANVGVATGNTAIDTGQRSAASMLPPSTVITWPVVRSARASMTKASATWRASTSARNRLPAM